MIDSQSKVVKQSTYTITSLGSDFLKDFAFSTHLFTTWSLYFYNWLSPVSLSLCIVCREFGIGNTIQRSCLLVNLRTSIKLAKSFIVFIDFFFQNKVHHEKIDLNILDNCFLKLRNLEGYTFLKMIDFKTLR